MSDEGKKGKQRHRLLVNPKELGLTARIKKALVEQDLGITQRIKRVIQKTQDENSFFYMRKNHFIIVGTLLFFIILLGILAFRSRNIKVELIYPDGKKVSTNLNLAFYNFSKKLKVPSYKRRVIYQRVDIYGSALEDKDFWVTTKDNKKVEDSRNLYPGVYTLHIRRKGYKPLDMPLNIGDVEVQIPIKLEPAIERKWKLKLYINDPLVEEDLEPDDVRIIGSNLSIKNTPIKPGKYAVIIEKAGYWPKETEITIKENGIVAEKVTLDYKERTVKFLVDDGLRKEGDLLEVKPNEIKLWKDGKPIHFKGKLEPGYYDLLVKRDGYYDYKDKIKILAGGDLLTIKLPLKTKAREILVLPNYDLAPPSLKPDKAYLRDLYGNEGGIIPITEGLKVKPGWYWVKVEKANYHPFSKKIFIEPSDKPFEIRANLIAVSKLLLLKIRSDFDVVPNINPDEMMIDMELKKKGFKGIDWGQVKQALPPEKKQIEVSVFLESIPRKIVTEIKSDITAGPITPDIITLTRIIEGKPEGQSIDLKGEDVQVKPGRYILEIKKVGYEDIKEEIIIYPDVIPYVIRKQLQAYRRPLIVKVDSNYSPGEFINDYEIRVNDEIAKSGIKLKPGVYNISIKKEGYYPIEKTINIEPGATPYIIKERLKTKPRRIVFKILGDKYKKVDPDIVTFDKKEVKEGAEIPPKKEGYEVRIKKRGYELWKKTCIIEPSNKPFELEAQLKPLKRKILLQVVASFPKGKDLLPLDEAHIGTETITEDTEVKPGKYEIVLIKSGYNPIKKTIEIEPDEGPFKIKEVMTPKPRDVDIEPKYDVVPENSDIKHHIKLTSEDGTIVKVIKEGDKIVPNKYTLEVEAEGYEPLTKKIVIPPSESTYTLKYELKAKPRIVTFKITSDYMPGKEIIPDKILLNGEPFFKDVVKLSNKIKPGKYTLIINKAGYHPIKKEIFIPAGTEDFVIKEQLISEPRVVTYKIIDAEKNRTLIPDKITLNGKPVTQTTPFKPGMYQLYISVQGYPEVTENINIPPGTGPYQIFKNLIPCSRVVEYEITGDYNLEPLIPKEITLNGKPIEKGSTFAPGAYDLVIYVPGYERLVKRIEIAPSKDPFIIREKLISKNRKVIFDIKGNYKNVSIKPDKVLFDDKEILDGEEVKPKLGGYFVTIEKEGYKKFSKKYIIEPSEESYILKAVLEARPRRLVFLLDSDYKPGVKIEPDEILIDNTKFEIDNILVLPGEHEVEIKKPGYETLKFKLTVEPSNEPLKIKKTLIAEPREVKVIVISEFNNEEMEPEVCTLGEKDVTEDKFKPGLYELDINHLGYMELRERIEITPGVGPFVIKRKLLTRKRKIIPKITYDVEPLPNTPPPVIRMRNIADPVPLRVQEGDELKPGEYRLDIEKEGYEPIHKTIVIVPDDRPYILKEEMSAKMVPIYIKITYDIEPPKDLPPYVVTFIDEKTGFGRNVTNGRSIKPGHYLLEVNRPGYEFRTPRKKIYVPPGTQPFWIREKLYAKPRSLSFEMIFGTKLVKAKEIIIDGKRVTAKDKFKPGEKYRLIAKFKEYKTAEKTIVIPPGEAPYVVDLDLVPLRRYEFRIAKRYVKNNGGMIIDNTRYPLEIYTDGEQVEPHHIEFDPESFNFALVFGSFYAPRRSRSVKIVVAFYYDDALIKTNMTFRDLKRIDINRLLDHLRELAKNTPSLALNRVKSLLKDRQDKFKIKALPLDDREKIVSLLRDLDLTSLQEQKTRNLLIKKLKQ